MKEKKERLQELADKWLDGSLTAEEREEFESWYNKTSDQYISIAEDKASYKEQLFSRISQETGIRQHKQKPLWVKIAAVAASVIVVLSVTMYLLPIKSADRVQEVAADIAPGHTGATLTLANGQKIRLAEVANGKLAEQTGISIEKDSAGHITYHRDSRAGDAKVQMNTLTTARGETYSLELPDGTKVWLNAASSLSYSVSLNQQKERLVLLTGEAYFKVAKDKARPFIVRHNHQDVEVLGTQFNVNTYDTQKLITTLEEGSVKITSGKTSKLIRPGEQLVNEKDKLSVLPADLEPTMAWKDGNFVFNGADIQTIMDQLQRWYDIEVSYQGEITDEVFYASISRYKHIIQVLEILKKTKAVDFDIKGRRVIVRKQ